MNLIGINVIIHSPSVTNGFNPLYIYIYICLCVCVCMYMQVISINHTTRPIHRLIRIKFGLNSLPTERMIGSGRLKLQQMSGESIEVKDLENGKNLVRKS